MAPARILIVDDEPFNRDVLVQELELLEHEAVTAIHGRDAFARLAGETSTYPARHHDAQMTGSRSSPPQGRDRSAHIPVIMISALDDITAGCAASSSAPTTICPSRRPGALEGAHRRLPEKKRWRDQEVAYLARIEGRMEEIERERARADRLLHAILPPSRWRSSRRALRHAQALRAGRRAVRRHRQLRPVLRAAPGRGGGR